MYIICSSNNGFEDQLTPGAQYTIRAIGSNGYQVENDQMQRRWYGASKFGHPLPLSCSGN